MAQPDLSEFERNSHPKKRACPVGEALAALSVVDKANLEAALATDKSQITNPAIVMWLAARDVKANVQSIVSHRRGTCHCHG